MPGGKRLSQRLSAMKKDREKNPRPKAKVLAPAGIGAMRCNSRENIDVLFAIESTIIRCWRQDDRVDDAVVWSVLRSLILEDPPANLPHAWLFSELLIARENCRLTDEEGWTECLRVIKDSVECHSLRQSGETSYLTFVEPSVIEGRTR